MENPYWLSLAHCLMFYLFFFLRSKYILANKLSIIIQRCKLGCRAVSILSCEMCWQFAQSKQYQFHLDDEGQANCLLLNRVAGDKFPEKCFSNWLIKHTSYFHIVITFFFSFNGLSSLQRTEDRVLYNTVEESKQGSS